MIKNKQHLNNSIVIKSVSAVVSIVWSIYKTLQAIWLIQLLGRLIQNC